MQRLILRQRRKLNQRWTIGVAAVAATLMAVSVATTPIAAAGPSSIGVAYNVSAVLVGSNGAIGALYQPKVPDPQEATAFLFSHDTANLIGTTACTQLAQRGYTVLCVKSEFVDYAEVTWDALALDIASGITELRSLGNVKHVILVGYSAGGPDVAYYQNVAQNGIATCQEPERLDPCGSDLANMPPADGVILLDSIPGALSGLSTLDPSVVNEKNLNIRNSSLNMFSPTNGYNPNGSSNYTTAFVNRYTEAQGARMNRLIKEAQNLLKLVKEGKGQYSDDSPMLVGAVNARPWDADVNLISHTVGKWPLISPQYPNGSPPQIVDSIRPPGADPVANSQWDQTDGGYTASTFLSTAAIRAPDFKVTADSITGVDWGSSNTSTILNVRGIKSPILIMGMTGHTWVVASEMYYNAAKNSSSKTLVYVEGASHSFSPCTACSGDPSTFGDTVSEVFNYISNWATQQFSN